LINNIVPRIKLLSVLSDICMIFSFSVFSNFSFQKITVQMYFPSFSSEQIVLVSPQHSTLLTHLKITLE